MDADQGAVTLRGYLTLPKEAGDHLGYISAQLHEQSVEPRIFTQTISNLLGLYVRQGIHMLGSGPR